MYLQKELTKQIFVDGMDGFYSQFFFFCIIRYIVFQFKHNFFEYMYKLFLHYIVWGKNI